MKAVILAAGEGVRMRPLTLTTPKSLVPLLGKPLLRHIVEALPPSVVELIIVTGYRGDQIKEYCGPEFLGRPVTYVAQTERKGTYHALELCKPYLSKNDAFAFLYSDDLTDAASIAECLSRPLAIVASHAEHPERFGVITLNADGTIREIEEKPAAPRSNLVTTATHMITPDIFNYPPVPHPANGEYYFATALGAMAREHPIEVVETKLWIPIGTPGDLARAETILKT
ncbi:MAG: sugar phosphate nucleotidyltransferase [Candidatus Jorgensenbacteria bacterium]